MAGTGSAWAGWRLVESSRAPSLLPLRMLWDSASKLEALSATAGLSQPYASKQALGTVFSFHKYYSQISLYQSITRYLLGTF